MTRLLLSSYKSVAYTPPPPVIRNLVNKKRDPRRNTVLFFLRLRNETLGSSLQGNIYIYNKRVRCFGSFVLSLAAGLRGCRLRNIAKTKEKQGKPRKTELRRPLGKPKSTQESSEVAARAPKGTPGGVLGCSSSSPERSRTDPGEPESALRAPRDLPSALRERLRESPGGFREPETASRVKSALE